MWPPNSPQKEKKSEEDRLQPSLGWAASLPTLDWPKLSRLVWSNRAEAGKSSLPYAQRENEWDLVNARNCHSPWDSLILHFADGETEGLRLGDVQQVTWRFGDNLEENSNFLVSDIIVWEREWSEKGWRRRKREGDSSQRALDRTWTSKSLFLALSSGWVVTYSLISPATKWAIWTDDCSSPSSTNKLYFYRDITKKKEHFREKQDCQRQASQCEVRGGIKQENEVGESYGRRGLWRLQTGLPACSDLRSWAPFWSPFLLPIASLLPPQAGCCPVRAPWYELPLPHCHRFESSRTRGRTRPGADSVQLDTLSSQELISHAHLQVCEL